MKNLRNRLARAAAHASTPCILQCGGRRFTAGGPASGGVIRSRRAHAVAARAPANFEISETRDMEIKK